MVNSRNHMGIQLTGLCWMNLCQMEQRYQNSRILNHILSAFMTISPYTVPVCLSKYLYIFRRGRRILAWVHSIWIPFTHAHTYPHVQSWKLSPLFSAVLSEYLIWIWCNFVFIWSSSSWQKTAALYQGKNVIYPVTGTNPPFLNV